MKKVLITGVTGQDGSHMVDYLLANTEHLIIAGVRRLSVDNHANISHLKDNPRFTLIDLDITDQINTERVVEEFKPDYFINFAANSFVGNSWAMPVNHLMTNTIPVLYQLEAIKNHAPSCRYYNAGSSEEFGNVDYSPQDIKHPFKPRSPYGVSKCSAHHLVKVYRESYNLYAIQGILFNHEGVRRGEQFVTRKISKEVARIYRSYLNGESYKPIELGNLDAMRDWSDAEDFVDGIWKMLNQENAPRMSGMCLPYKNGELDLRHPQSLSLLKDYILSSGETHSIREFVEVAFATIGFKKADCVWDGEGLEERYILKCDHGVGVDAYETLVKINPDFYRPAEVSLLHGDSLPARNELGWRPKVTFVELVKKMVIHDIGGYSE